MASNWSNLKGSLWRGRGVRVRGVVEGNTALGRSGRRWWRLAILGVALGGWCYWSETAFQKRLLVGSTGTGSLMVPQLAS